MYRQMMTILADEEQTDGAGDRNQGFGNSLRLKKRLWGPVLAASSIFLVYCSLAPMPMISSNASLLPIIASDKALHVLAYAAYALILGLYLLSRFGCNRWRWFQAWCITSCCGAFLEAVQFFMQSGRQGDWADAVANVLGALLACLILRQWVEITRFRSESKRRVLSLEHRHSQVLRALNFSVVES